MDHKKAGHHLQRLLAVPTAIGLASRLALTHLERNGQDAAPLLKKARIDRSALSPGGRVSVASQITFLDLASRVLEDDWLGLTLATDFDLREMGLLYYVAASSTSLGDALQRLERYVQLGNEALVVRIKKGATCRIGLSYAHVPRYRDRQQMELFAVSFLRLCRQLLGKNVIPVSTSFSHHRSGDLRRLRRLFGDDVRFDAPVDEICLEGGLLDAHVISADPFLNFLMTNCCDEAIARRSSNTSALRARVENAIAPMLPHREANANSVARQLGMSERTMARRLKVEGLTFEKILDELRRELAVRYLAERDLPMSQVAWLLGYNSPSALSHACRRLIGKSPSAHRRDAGSGVAIPS